MLRQLGVLGLVSLFHPLYALGQLGTPVGEKPSGPAPEWTEYRWTAVPEAEYYMLRFWTTDHKICNSEEQFGAGDGETRYNPYVLVFPAFLCNEEECGIRQYPRFQLSGTTKNIPTFFLTQDKVSMAAARAEVSRTAGQTHGQPNHSASAFIPIQRFSRSCSEKFTPPPPARCGNRDDKNHGICQWGVPRNGPLIEWRWTVQALAGWDPKTNTWAKEGMQSNPVMYHLEENPPKQPPTPTPTPELKPHPITFANRSGMTLYVYYFFDGTVGCKGFRNGGKMADGQSSQQFIIPAKSSAQFVFQKSPDPCTFDQQFTTRNSRGGNPVPETMVISR